LTTIDVLTKKIGEEILSDKTAESVLGGILSIYAGRRLPKVIQTDMGAEFKNQLLRDFCGEYDIELRPVGPRRPELQSVVERAHQTIKDSLAKEYS